MKKNQKIYNGKIQMFGFPMRYMNITQGNNGQVSHQGVCALDLAGKDTGCDEVYAPCDMIFKFRDSVINGNALFFESTNKVRFADGTTDYATIMVIHDNYVEDVIQKAIKGHVFKMGEKIADEGSAGKAYGNHTHFEVAKGKYTYAYVQNSLGVWHLPNSISADKCCFTNGTIILNGNGMKWKDYKGWTKGSKGWWWDNGDETYPKSTFKVIGSKIYYFDQDGWMVEGWKYINNEWYYFEPSKGNMVDGWKKIDNKWYYFNEDLSTNRGIMQYGWLEWNNHKYYLDGKGQMVTGHYRIDGIDYKFDSKGKLV